MIITVETAALKAALITAGRVVPSKAMWPILQNIKIVTNDSRATLIGSNADITFETDIAADVETEGVAALPFAPLREFIGRVKADNLTITVDGDTAKVSAGRNRISLSAAKVEDFPNYRPPAGTPVELDRDTFCTALRFCAAATEEDETRYTMAGPNISEGKGEILIWGTEGKTCHRARIADVDCIGGGGTLPLGAAMTVLAVAEKAERIAFMICDRGFHLEAGAIRVWGKVIDAQFPDMEKVTAQYADWSEILVTTHEDLADAVGVATCGADAGSDRARNLILRSEEGRPIVVRGQRAVGGVLHAGRAETGAEGRGAFAGAVSAKYLTGALSGMKAEDVILLAAQRGDGMYAISLRPAQQSATVELSAIISTLRTSDAELVDV